jgi:hypothetical protein
VNVYVSLTAREAGATSSLTARATVQAMCSGGVAKYAAFGCFPGMSSCARFSGAGSKVAPNDVVVLTLQCAAKENSIEISDESEGWGAIAAASGPYLQPKTGVGASAGVEPISDGRIPKFSAVKFARWLV